MQAQLVEPHLLLLDWGALHGSNHDAVQAAPGPGAPPAPGQSGLQQSQYIALYDWRKARVRAFLASTSDAAIALLYR